MKKIFQKYGWVLAMTAAALGIVLFCAGQVPFPQKPDIPVEEVQVQKQEEYLRFRIEGAPHAAELLPYALSDGVYCVFLPSFAGLEQVRAVVPEGMDISLGDTLLADGMDCGSFETETEYHLAIGNNRMGDLRFMRSANVPALYIETASGSMDEIHTDKNHEEGASVTLISGDGVLLHTDDAGKLKGRGNATWLSEKKSYLLTLSTEEDLLEMGAATKWVLLSNYADETCLRNKLIYDMAAAAGFAWTPQVSYVDVYLNGQYNGLYLLAEKMETGPNRLELDLDNGDFLCKVDLDIRWETLRHPFWTKSGRVVEISEPAALHTRRKDEIVARVTQLESRIFSGEDLALARDFDLDSWVRRYLVDEISANIDADYCSSYFYYQNGVFYGGPIWDYDMTLGNSFRNPRSDAFYAKNRYIEGTDISNYYGALCENESFQKRVREIYAAEFRPILERMLNGGIREQAAWISAAAHMNNLRWREELDHYYDTKIVHPTDTDDLYTYLEERVVFLDSAWLQNKEYCTVQLEAHPGDVYQSYTVEKGTPFAAVNPADTVWYDRWTGEVVETDTVIDRDRILTVWYSPQREQPVALTVRLSIAVMAGMLVILLVMDFRMRKKERRKADERAETHISP